MTLDATTTAELRATVDGSREVGLHFATVKIEVLAALLDAAEENVRLKDRIAALEAEVAELKARKYELVIANMRKTEEKAASERRADRLAGLLRDARETIAHWGSYAGEYFQQKHNLAGDLAEIDAALADEPGGKENNNDAA